MKKCKKHIAIALSIAMMLPSVVSTGTISTKAAEAEDTQIDSIVTDVGEDSGLESDVESDVESDGEASEATDTGVTDDVEEAEISLAVSAESEDLATEDDSAKEDLDELVAGKVKVSEEYFPDAKFRELIRGILEVSDGDTLTEAMANSITEIDVSGYTAISDLTGIGYFTKLATLKCNNDGLTSLDISNLTELTYLDCSYNSLKALNVQNNTKLESLYCHNNSTSFFELNVDALKVLKVLSCSNNPIGALSLTNNTELTYLACNNTSILTLDVSGCKNLEFLDCGNTAISKLDLSNNANLQVLACYETKLTNLDVSNHTELTDVIVGYKNINGDSSYLGYLESIDDAYSDNSLTSGLVALTADTGSLSGSLTSLDLSGCTSLVKVYCDNNSLASINIDGDTALTELHCNYNKLTELDVTKETALTVLQCYDNSLSKLDVGNNVDLTRLFCEKNQFESIGKSKDDSINISNNTSLEILICNNNKLQSLDVSPVAASLVELNCNNNALTVLDLSSANAGCQYALRYLKCDSNNLTSLDITNTTIYKLGGDGNIIDCALSCTGNTYSITLNDVYEYELNELPGKPGGYTAKSGVGIPKFDDKGFTSGAYYYNDAYRLVPSLNTTSATYSYVVGSNEKTNKNVSVSFTLKFDSVNITALLDGDSVALSGTTSEIFVGKSVKCTAVNSKDKTQEMPKITWSSDDENIATIDKDTGELIGVSAGEAKIHVWMNGYDRGYFTVKMIQPVEEITLLNGTKDITGKKLNLEVGDYSTVEKNTVNISTSVAPDNATHKGVTWTATPSNVVSVTNIITDGEVTGAKITAAGAGTATVTAMAADGSGVVASFEVSVKQLVNSIKISKNTISVGEGQTATLTGSVQPTTAENQAVVWSSADEDIATVAADGVVTGVSAGETTITCRSEENSDVQAYATVTVLPGPKKITLNKSEYTLYLGSTDKKTFTLEGTVTPDDAFDTKLTWSSSDTSVATVSSKGVVTAKGVGTAEITATSNVNEKVTAVCTITVKQYATGVTIANTTGLETLLPGGTQQLTATVAPTSTADQDVTWLSDDTSIATVSATGLVTAKAVGETTITCTAADGSGKVATATVKVLQPVTNITFASSISKTVFVGKTTTITPTIAPSDAANTKVTWESANTSIATVTSAGVIKGIKKGSVKLTCTAADGSGVSKTITITVKQPVTGISLDKTTVSLLPGKTATVTATIAPEDADDTNVIWTSSDESVASVVDGVITAIGVGSAKITCTAADGSEEKSNVAVTVLQPVTDITLSGSTSVFVGKTITITAAVAPEKAANSKVTWKSSDTSIATVSSAGVVKGVNKGSVKITCTAADGSGENAIITITVKQPVKSITLDQTEASILKGKTATVTATVAPDTANTQSVKWASSDTTIATVTSKGKITAKGVGSAIITCTAADGSGTKAECKVTVLQPVTGITLSGKTSVFVGKTITIKPTVTPDDAANSKVTWKSSDTSIATVSSAGVVKGIKKGSVEITCMAADGSGVVSEPYTITVKQPVKSITLDSTKVSILKGKTATVTATVAPDTANNRSVKWTSSDTAVATVTSKGKITAKGVGSAIITCTAADGSGVKNTVAVTVLQPVTSIALKGTTSVFIGKTTTITSTVKPSKAADSTVTWSSSDTKIATVTKAGVVKGIAKGTATITCTAADGSGVYQTVDVTVKQPVIGITLKKTASLLNGKTVTLKATVTPTTANNKKVTWTTSNSKIASVTSDGVVTANKVGTATITCTAADGSGQKAECTVTVLQPVTGITLTGTTSVFIGKTTTITATVAPTSAANKSVTWKSSNEKVATVTAKGVVKGIAKGTATITCTAADGSGVKKTVKITVKQPVTGITLDKTSVSVLKGKTATVKATVAPTTANNTNVKWTSSDTAVATVTSAGKITAKKVGTATITCTAADGSGVKKTVAVTVQQPVTGITLKSASGTSVFVGKTVTVSATVAPTSAANKKVTWKSSDTTIATVSSAGVVKGVKKGTVTITCTAADGSAVYKTISITVKQPVTKISFDKTSLTLAKGKSVTLSPTVTPTNANDKSVTWTTSDASVATVTTAGKVTAKKTGTVTITCTAADGSGKKATVKITVK